MSIKRYKPKQIVNLLPQTGKWRLRTEITCSVSGLLLN